MVKQVTSLVNFRTLQTSRSIDICVTYSFFFFVSSCNISDFKSSDLLSIIALVKYKAERGSI